MDEPAVAETLASLHEGWVRPNRVRLLAELSQIYEGEHVLTAHRALALHRACPAAESCWARARERVPGAAETCWSGDENGSIFWPWVGEQYRSGGVCVVLENIHHHGEWWSITDEYAIAGHTNRQLAEGRRRMAGGSLVGYRRGATAMAAVASLDGKIPVERPDPREIPTAWDRVAMLQAVKCSPLGDLSHGTPEMFHNCPPRYLAPELGVIQPGVVIALGARAQAGIERSGAVTWTREDANYRRGVLVRSRDRTAELLVVPHPQARGRSWPSGQAALVADLLRTPLRNGNSPPAARRQLD